MHFRICTSMSTTRRNKYNLSKPNFCLGYADDILAAFGNKQDSLNFINFLNEKHPSIKLKTEKQVNHSIVLLYLSFRVLIIQI